MRTFQIFALLLSLSGNCGAACAQNATGTPIGLPNNSPVVLWPAGMSIETLSPNKLYPNGPGFGLSNTSGGFGTSGTGPMSGVGLELRSVSPLTQGEQQRSFSSQLLNPTRLVVPGIISAPSFEHLRAEIARPLDRETTTSQDLVPTSRVKQTDDLLHDKIPDSYEILQPAASFNGHR